MTRFVGLDVSQKITAICVVDDAGRRLWRGQCPTNPEQISILVRRHAGDDARIGIETGAMTPWLVHELRNLGLEVICLDARHARAALKMQINKTDQNDAEGLAQIVRTGWYRSVHVKSLDSHRARAILRHVRTVEHQSFDLPIEWQSLHRAWQKAEGLEYPPDVVGQSGPHTNELRPQAQNELALRGNSRGLRESSTLSPSDT